MRKLFTSESVTSGHPDKVCDQISDAILDAALQQDRNARIAVETACAKGTVVVMGETNTTANIDVEKIVRNTLKRIGYTSEEAGIDADACRVEVLLNRQSPDIVLGVDRSLEAKDGDDDELSLGGAGDQGLMFGYACNETASLLPLPIALAHELAYRLESVRKLSIIPYLKPDGKTQVTVEYDENRTPVRVDTIVISAQHNEEVSLDELKSDIKRYVIDYIVPEELIDSETRVLINPTGRFVVGGPAADAGLTGRKIIVDTYGGYARHGGGAFSGKDPSKVDRSAAYYARYIAKSIVAAGLASECEVQLAYAIGVAEPVSILIDTHGTGVLTDEKISDISKAVFDARPNAIIKKLRLREQKYEITAAYGHFGRQEFPWENVEESAEKLRELAKEFLSPAL